MSRANQIEAGGQPMYPCLVTGCTRQIRHRNAAVCYDHWHSLPPNIQKAIQGLRRECNVELGMPQRYMQKFWAGSRSYLHLAGIKTREAQT